MALVISKYIELTPMFPSRSL